MATLDNGPTKKVYPLAGVWTLLVLAFSLVGIFTILAETGTLWWFGEVLSHFRLHYALILCVAVSIALYYKRWVLLTMSLVCLLLASRNIAAQLTNTGPEAATATASANLDLVLFNVLRHSDNKEAIEKYLIEENADLVALVETGDDWEEEFTRLKPMYPEQVAIDPGDGYGMAILSRYPLYETRRFFIDQMPTLSATLETPKGQCHMILAHLTVADSDKTLARRNSQMEVLAAMVNALPKGTCAMVLGDFNISPGSPFYRPWQERLGLFPLGGGRLFRMTWPSLMPAFGIVIDHIFLSANLTVIRDSIGPHLGSDHLPLRLTLDTKP